VEIKCEVVIWEQNLFQGTSHQHATVKLLHVQPAYAKFKPHTKMQLQARNLETSGTSLHI
jgi:hypothetical protein